MAGLTAACYLARAGVGVTLFEKAPYLGGRAATREFDGFLFNLGGHALYTGGAASRRLRTGPSGTTPTISMVRVAGSSDGPSRKRAPRGSRPPR